MKTFLSLFIVVALCSCQTTKQISSLATPANVQTAISVLGASVLSKVTTGDKAIIHQVATTLLSLTAATVDSTTIAPLEQLIPQLSNAYAKALVTAGLVNLNLALASFGAHNVKVVAYANAVGNGLLSAGY